MIVQIFVAQRQTDHPLADHLPQPVFDEHGVAPVHEALGEAAQQIDAAVDLPQQQHPAVAAQPVGRKLGHHLPGKMGRKLEGFLSTLCHQKGRPVSRINFVFYNAVMPETTASFHLKPQAGINPGEKSGLALQCYKPVSSEISASCREHEKTIQRELNMPIGLYDTENTGVNDTTTISGQICVESRCGAAV